ncbi:MAG: hypothetical protein ABS916_09510 [Carnobacterium sp.]|uniref:hypothetical protein n=1 Tax=Carnobacterium sp. TaxID=48221 RepID=UPI003314AB0E
MGKHIIEEEALTGSGFNLIKVEDGDEITADNTNRVLNVVGDGTVDLDVENNKLKITTRVPVFKTLDW